MFTYIANVAHYKEVLSRVQSVNHMLWIGTADIKVVIFIFAFDFKQRYGEFTRFTNGFKKCYFFI